MRHRFRSFCFLWIILFGLSACSDDTAIGSRGDAADAGDAADEPGGDLVGDTVTDDVDPEDAGPDDVGHDGAHQDADPDDAGVDVGGDLGPDNGTGDAGFEDVGSGDAGGDAGFEDVGGGDVGVDVGFDAGEPVIGTLRIVAANLTSGTRQEYEAPGIRILQGLAPDIGLLQEFRYDDESTFAFGDLDGFVAGTFGEDYDYYVGPGGLPNGIVSRFPIVDSGSWDDATLDNREFDWARIDIPGGVDLWAVSVHLKASSGDAAQRNVQAGALVDFIEANVPAADYLVIGGDLNTWSRGEACVGTLSSVVQTGAPWPEDASGNGNTNAGRDRPYDWVMTDTDLGGRGIAVAIGAQSFADGLVVDTRVYTPLADIAPAASGDSGASNMQHMAVVRDFQVTCTPRAQTFCTDDALYWQDDCGNPGPFRRDCDCGCDGLGAACRPCSCEADTCNGNGDCSVVEGAAACECDSGCGGEYCDRCGLASQPIAVSSSFACVLERSGSVACWGSNNDGQALAPEGSAFSHVDVGADFACALDAIGRITCWGDNDYGQSSPPGGSDFVELSLGPRHGCARRENGSIACWGEDGEGRISAPGGSGFIDIATGTAHSCALDADGGVVCWGRFAARPGTPGGTGFTRVAALRDSTCALDSAGGIACWGAPQVAPPPEATGFAEIALGGFFGLVLDGDGDVVCWGDCEQLASDASGLTDLVASESTACALTASGAPTCWGFDYSGVASVPPTDGVSALSTGYYNFCVRDGAGTLSCIGDDYLGRSTPPAGTGYGAFEVSLAHGCALTDAVGAITCWGSDDDDEASPPPETGYQDIAAGTVHSCAIDADDQAVCWGRDTIGETEPPDGSYLAVSAGVNYSCGLLADRSIDCWGTNLDGGLDAPDGTDFEHLVVRASNACAVREGGSLACWGWNAEEAPPPSGAFTDVAPGAIACDIIGGFFECEPFSCGVRSDGSLDCWGTLGLDELEPPEGDNFVEVDAGDGYMCALDEDGVVQCWGDIVRPPSLDVP